MPDVISTFTQLGVKSCNIPMEDLGLMLRSNGEQEVSIIDRAGNIFLAGIPEPTYAPTLVSVSSVANKVLLGYYAYTYCYAATTKYPSVDAGVAINGSIAPRGNPSDTLVVHATNASNQITINLTGTTRKDIIELWVFRTDIAASQTEAELAAAAGRLFYIGKANNVFLEASIAYIDGSPSVTLDKVEYDNFQAPQFAYGVYESPYVWGIGNPPFIADVSWDGTVVNLSDSNRNWFSARNGQVATVTGITTGGFDQKGSFYFIYKDAHSCYLSADGSSHATLAPTTGSGVIKIQGVASTLYRSKANNPLAWGETIVYGTTQVAQLFARRVGGGFATAIGTLPGGELLKIDTKSPNSCYVYNLRLASQAEFTTSRRKISDFSVGSHFSQFKATTQDGQKVLWGFDPDSFAILQSDGNSQIPISFPLQILLKNVDTNPDRIKFAHGICNETNHLNCMWLPMFGKQNNLNGSGLGSTSYVAYEQVKNWTDLGIVYNYLTGKWSTSFDGDLTASGSVRDNYKDRITILGGTSTGILGNLFDTSTQLQWASLIGNGPQLAIASTAFSASGATGFEVLSVTLDSALFSGLATTTAALTEALKGTWALLTQASNEQRIYLRISAIEINVTTPTLVNIYFDCWIFDTSIIIGEFAEEWLVYENYIWDSTVLNTLYSGLGTTGWVLYLGQAPTTIIKQIQVLDSPADLKKLEYVDIPGDARQTFYGRSFVSANPIIPIQTAPEATKDLTASSPASLGLPFKREIWLRFHIYVGFNDTLSSLRYMLIKIAQ